MAIEQNVAIKYALEYTDRGLARAVAATRTLEQQSQKTGAAVTLASRRQSDAWKLLDRDARSFDSQTTRRALTQSTAVSRSVEHQVGQLRKLGASYSEIGKMLRTYGATAEQTSGVIRRSFDQEASAAENAARRQEAAVKRIAAARNTLSRLPAAALGVSGGGGSGVGRREERSFVRGTVRGTVSRGGAFLGGGLVGGLAGLVSVQGIKSAIDSTKELAKETRYLTQVTGMDAKTAAEWVAVAQSRGISSAQLNVGLRTLSKVADQALSGTTKGLANTGRTLAVHTEAALQGSKKQIAAFQALGISYQQVNSRQHDSAALTDLVTSRLAKMRDGVLKTTIANTLLGKSGAQVSQTAGAFKELGISQDQLKAHSHDLSGLMGLVADKLNKMRGGTAKAALEAKLFGRNAAALQPILQEGSRGMEQMRRQAAAYGVTLGGDPVKNAHKLEEASYNLKLAQIGLSVQFTEHVAPALIKATTFGVKLAVAIGHELAPAFKTLSPVVKDVGHWLGENKGIVIGLVGAFAALKIVRTVGGWFGGLYNDAKRVVNFGRGVVGMFTEQADKAAAETVAMNELAAALQRVALAQKEITDSQGLGVMPGGAPGIKTAEKAGIGAAEKGIATAGTEEKLAQSVMQNAQQGGMLQAFFGRTGLASLTQRLGIGKAAGAAGEAGKIAGVAGEGAVVAEDAAKAAGLIGKLGPALGAVGKFAGPIGLAISAFQGADAFLSTHGNLGERLGATTKALTFGLIGNDPTNVQQRAQGMRRGVTSFGGFQADQTGALSARGITQYQARLSQLQQQLKSVSGTQIRSPMTGQLETIGRDSKVMLDREAQIRTLTALFNREQAAALKAGVATDQRAQGFSRWSTAGAQLKAITPQLDKLTGQWQNAGALSAIKYARGLEQNGRLPRGATDKLIRDLEGRYPQLAGYLQQQGATSMQALADQIRVNRVQRNSVDLINSIHKTFGFLPTYAETAGSSTQAKMRTAMDALKRIIQTGTAAQVAAAKPELAALQAAYATYTGALRTRTHDDVAAARSEVDRLGGSWRSLGSTLSTVVSQTILPSLSSVSAGFNNLIGLSVTATPTGATINHSGRAHHREGGYIVPGDPTRDATLILAAGDEVVLTGDGQRRMDAHAPGLLNEIVGSQLPHFAAGGFVPGGLGWPTAAHHSRHHTSSHHRASHPRGTHPATAGHFAGVSFTGAVSTFGPPGEASGTTAYGGTDAVPGIAINPGDSTGGWNGQLAQSLAHKTFLVQVGGHQAFLQVIDKGPSARAQTGPYAGRPRTIDITGTGAQRMGFQVGPGGAGFPTDATGVAREWVGSAPGGLYTAKSPTSATLTSFVAAGKGLGADAFDVGYQYGLDPTQGTGPGAALAAATAGASLRAVKHTVKLAPGASAGSPSGVAGGGRPAQVYASMMAAARRIVGKPYGHTGGHGTWDASNYDCSGAAGYVLHAAGLHPNFGWTGSDVSWGAPGPGKYVTLGIRNANSSVQGHEMLKFFGRYLESGGGGPYGQPRVHWDPGWDNPFQVFRHPPGLRRGGHIPRPRPGGIVRNRLGHPVNRNEADTIRRFRSGGAIHTPSRPPRRTPHPPAGLRISGGGSAVLPALPSSLGYDQIGGLQQDLALIPVQAVDIGVRTTRLALAKLTAALRAIAGTPNDSKIRHAMASLSGVLNNVGAVSYRTLQNTATAIQHELGQVARGHGSAAGKRHETARLTQALRLVEYQMGARTGAMVRVAENQASALQGAQTRLTRLMDRKGIDQASAQGLQMLEAFDRQSVTVLRSTVSRLQQAYRMAKKAGDKKALSDIGQKLTDALDNLDQAVTDQIVARRQGIEAAAQQVTDQATHQTSLATAGEQALQLRQQIAGTYQTPAGGRQTSDYIKGTVMPALQGELDALQKQQATAKQEGDQQLADQIAEAIAGKQNDILQAQLDAQTAIKDATQQTAQNTADTSGTLAVGYQGQALPNLASVLTGA